MTFTIQIFATLDRVLFIYLFSKFVQVVQQEVQLQSEQVNKHTYVHVW